MTRLYGISNCDTIRKAKKWLDGKHIDYQFHDFRKEGLTRKQLTQWCDELGWENLLNKRSTTWRNLPDEAKNAITQDKAINIMLEQPAIIKRPVLDLDKRRVIGFNEKEYKAIFK